MGAADRGEMAAAGVSVRVPHPAELLPWRVGRKVGRTIYMLVGAEPSDEDVLIGVMDARELARDAVYSHNAALERGWRR